MSGLEIIGTLLLLLALRIVLPAILVFGFGSLLKKAQPA
jgi:hypothetical protein